MIQKIIKIRAAGFSGPFVRPLLWPSIRVPCWIFFQLSDSLDNKVTESVYPTEAKLPLLKQKRSSSFFKNMGQFLTTYFQNEL